jgi:DNA-directed RNA polymerase sigma subunit (sigma70/sigma32)
MSNEGQQRWLTRQTTRCGSFWMLCTIFCSQNNVGAFSHGRPFTRNQATHCRCSTRIPSRLLVKGGNEKETPSKQRKSLTVKLLEEEKRKSTRKQTNRVPLYQSEYLDHEILTADEEKVLGKKIRKAVALKEEIRAIIEEKEAMEFERFIKQEEYSRLLVDDGFFDLGMGSEGGDDFSSLFTHGLDGSFVEEKRRQKNQFTSNIEIQPVDQYLDDLWAAKTSIESTTSSGGDQRRDVLSDDDLNRLGGREAISQILVEGAIAREKLISSNIRLVLSVAKKWCKNAVKSSGGSDNFAVIYGGSWTRPSLDEAVQEGIIGLATAADRFDYKLNLRFSTYATFWIVNFVRRCFQNASTGGFRVPLVRINNKVASLVCFVSNSHGTLMTCSFFRQNYHLIKQQV